MPTKILSRNQLAQVSAQMRADGQRLVLTNGCFDLLHVGHVRYLAAARELGDALAVALNSDASVRALKGTGRPVTAEEERAEILASLSSVDYVTIFDEERATDIVAVVRPAIYVKGGDYSPDPTSPKFPVEGPTAIKHGGEVRVIEYVPGHSTSEIIRRISC